MKVYADGMELMKETGSLTNALMENKPREIKPGDSFSILLWSDRTLWQVTRVISQTEFFAKKVSTYMKDWADGTCYPKVNADGNWDLSGDEIKYKKCRKYWYEYARCPDGTYDRLDSKVHFSWGSTTGYRDPSF